MSPETLLSIAHLTEGLKDELRHCYTSGGRRESVAEHCWRMSLLALFLKDEFPEADMDRVIRMCLIHDLGELFIGDIPAFDKTAEDEAEEEQKLQAWVASLPAPYDRELRELYAEMDALSTTEARIYKALDKLEAVIQHNESELSTWNEGDWRLQFDYGKEQAAFSPYLKAFRALAEQETLEKTGGAIQPSGRLS